MTTRIRVTAAELKAHWLSNEATGMIHDHSTNEVVVTMNDGTEYACSFCSFDEHHAAIRGEQP